jgi:hypothetical protein
MDGIAELIDQYTERLGTRQGTPTRAGLAIGLEEDLPIRLDDPVRDPGLSIREATGASYRSAPCGVA